MTKNELKKAIEAVLPKRWRLDYISMKTKCFKVTCPIEHRFDAPPQSYERKIRRIERATNAEYDGGGAVVGDYIYDNFFYFN